MSADDSSLLKNMLATYGPLMSGVPMRRALGYETYAAFRLARSKGDLGVNVFNLPKRRGIFALTQDVARWLEEQAGQEAGSADDLTDTKEQPM